MGRQHFRPVGASGTHSDRLPRPALRWPWADRGCPVGAQRISGSAKSASGGAFHTTCREVGVVIRTMCETTHRNQSRIFGRFGVASAESEITVKKLGTKFQKTAAQGKNRAAVISLENRKLVGEPGELRFLRERRASGCSVFHAVLENREFLGEISGIEKGANERTGGSDYGGDVVRLCGSREPIDQGLPTYNFVEGLYADD